MGAEEPTAEGARFNVVLRRTGAVLEVPADRSILEVVEEVVAVPFTCRAGDCGSCVTTVLAGTPDYRNSVLSPRARAAARRVALCIDRSLTPTLELDL
ncbi:2Fe-2S iron-sulfur cluster binding domain-containing protein [Kineococcus aurantiacus]|uniref:2Fe-2S iron-sulfur cluster-binding protein n=1 Tax=Kineococcus aurantiacus TaxID=37633 RepID=UPI0031E30E78